MQRRNSSPPSGRVLCLPHWRAATIGPWALPARSRLPAQMRQGGIFSTIVEAVIKGAVQGATRQLAPKRRRRSASSNLRQAQETYDAAAGSTTPSLEQIFGELLGTLRR